MDIQENNFISEYTKKCFLLRENLIISILKMATGKDLDNLEEEDAKRMLLTSMVGEPQKEKVYFDNKLIGEITCDLTELKVLYTFTPYINQTK